MAHRCVLRNSTNAKHSFQLAELGAFCWVTVGHSHKQAGKGQVTAVYLSRRKLGGCLQGDLTMREGEPG